MPRTKQNLSPQDALRLALMTEEDWKSIRTYDLSRAAAFLTELAAGLTKEVNRRVEIGAYI